MRGSADFSALAELFKRVKNIAREVSPQPLPAYEVAFDRDALSEPAELALLAEHRAPGPAIAAAVGAADYPQGDGRGRRVAGPGAPLLHRGLRHGRRRRACATRG